MIQQILWALVLASITVVIHAAGSVQIVLPLARRSMVATRNHSSTDVTMLLVRLVGGLLILHVVEMTVWAAAFRGVGLFDDFEDAMYYSLKSYTTVGYGDLLPPRSFRLLGPIEAAVGVLMLGISTSVIVMAVQLLRFRSDDHSQQSTSSTNFGAGQKPGHFGD